MPFVRCVASPQRLPGGGRHLHTSATVLAQLAEGDGTTPPARRTLRALRDRFAEAAVGFPARLAPFDDPAVVERLGASFAAVYATALVGPTVRLTPAELAAVSLAAEAARLQLPAESRALLAPVLDALWSDEGRAAPAPALEAYLAEPSPAPDPEATAR